MAASPLDSVATDNRGLTTAPNIPPTSPLRWRREVAVIAVFYGLYSVIRDIRGSRPVSAFQALRNAKRVIGWERTLGVFREARIQHAILGDRWLVRLLDDWYGSTHFVVTTAVLVALFFIYPKHYRRWRNTLAGATGLALIGFAWFPLMPPRLLPARYGFTDTLRVVGGLWNFSSGPVNHLSDQYAAMPSLHFAWALWCGLALSFVVRRWWLRLLALCYPAVTLACVIVTANHFFADTAAGAAIVAIGFMAATGWDKRPRRTPLDKYEPMPAGGVEPPTESVATPAMMGRSPRRWGRGPGQQRQPLVPLASAAAGTGRGRGRGRGRGGDTVGCIWPRSSVPTSDGVTGAAAPASRSDDCYANTQVSATCVDTDGITADDFLGVGPEPLSWGQASILAGLLRGLGVYNPDVRLHVARTVRHHIGLHRAINLAK